MDPGGLIGSIGVYAATFVIAVVGSLLPIVSIEVFLIGLVHVVGPVDALPVVVLAALGQLLGKLPVYYGARGLASLQARRVARLRTWFSRLHPAAMLAASALLGLPPFSLAATAAGVLAIPVRVFCAVIAVCRGLRFAIILAVAG